MSIRVAGWDRRASRRSITSRTESIEAAPGPALPAAARDCISRVSSRTNSGFPPVRACMAAASSSGTGPPVTCAISASQARQLMNRLTRDLEAADVSVQDPQPAHGAAYLPVFAETSKALLARLRATQ